MTDQVETIVPDRKPYTYFDEKARERAINFCRENGRYVGLMAKAAGVSYQTLSHYLKTDEEFKAEIDLAVEERAVALEGEARRRAMEGVTRRKYDKEGNLIEEEQVYSDRLMERLLEADIEKFKSKNPFQKDGGIGGVLLIPVVPMDQSTSVSELSSKLEQLSVAQRRLEETEGGTKDPSPT